MSKIILASESPFRKALLLQLGLNFETARPEVDEEALKETFRGEQKDLARFLAKAKALSLFEKFPESYVIGSDQVLVLEDQILNKPKSLDEVIERLVLLQGKTHYLHTSVAVAHQGQVTEECIIAKMEMRALSPSEIQKYAELDQAIGCAGGYKIESKAPLLFNSIETPDHYSIIGLPLLSLMKILRNLGFSPL